MIKVLCNLCASACIQTIFICAVVDDQSVALPFLLFTFILNAVPAILLRSCYSLRRPVPLGKDKAKANRNRRSFNAVEASGVFCLAALLLTLVLPVVVQAREEARSATCRNNLRHHTGPCLRVFYRGKLQSGSHCPETLPDGTPYPTIYKHDVAWHESWGDLPQSDSTTTYDWAKWYGCHPNADGWYYGFRYFRSVNSVNKDAVQ